MSTPKSPFFDRLLHRMSPVVVESFTPAQLEELQKALSTMQSGKHTIDIRLTIPFPKRGFYCVIFAGRERRSPERLRRENSKYIYASAAGGLFLLVALAALTVPTILWLVQINTASRQSEIYPTAIPWLQDQKACEETGRTWQDQQCWDSEWSHMF